jgi:soluble lytic murein transglycosylase-like protein
MKTCLKTFIIIAGLTSILHANIRIYYFYDPLKDRYTFTNQCADLRACKPLYETKGAVKHKKGYALKPGNESAFDDMISKASQKHGVDFHLIKSVIKAESLFDIKAVSTAGAKGLMQLMPGTAIEVGVKDVFDPEQNIMGGTKYLKKMLGKFKNTKNALAGYNAGPAAVVYYEGVPPFKETINYGKTI